MYKKLFGETVEAQEKYLKIRVIASMIAVVLLLIDFLFIKKGFSELFCVVVLLMWGWSVLKALWGVTSFLSIFSISSNIAVTVVILIVYIMLGYFAGIVIFPIGVYRYISLMVKKNKQTR